MLKLTVILSEDFDDENQEFVIDSIDIELEHSLASLSKWEEIWEIPLLTNREKTAEQNLSYIECMCVTPNVAPETFTKLSTDQMEAISDYLEKKATATIVSDGPPEAKSGETITSELIYFWMSSFNINWESQYWHINRLLTLIKVFSVKQDNKPRKQSPRQRQDEIARINAQRRKELGSKG